MKYRFAPRAMVNVAGTPGSTAASSEARAAASRTVPLRVMVLGCMLAPAAVAPTCPTPWASATVAETCDMPEMSLRMWSLVRPKASCPPSWFS